ncbi:MAG: hypothetical protein JOZ10_04950, partial [Acidobacteria bacterium]|nr:hypothetical protein [Acidobacteriota bacterium]
ITPAPASATTSVTIVAVGAYVITSIASATTPNPPTGVNAFQKGQDVNLQATIANNGASSPSGNLTLKLTCNAPCQFGTTPSATVAAPAAGQSTTATLILPALALTPAVGYVATLSIDAASAPPQSSTAGNSATFAFDVADFMLANASNISGDLNVKLGSQGMFNVNLTEQGVDVGSIPVTIGPAVSGISYQTPSSFSSNSTNTITVLASGNALPGASTPVTITGTRFGVSHAAMQSVRTYTASLENFSPGQPGSLQTQPIILPIKGAAPTLNIRLSGNFYTPGGGTQLTFPTVSGISITPSATTAAAGDVIALQIAAIQGAALNQTIPLIINAQIPNTNPAATETLTIFVRPTALPDLAVSGVSVSGRNFAANPLLSGEPVDVQITVANLGAGSSQGFERVHLGLNGRELTNGGVSVPQALAAGSSTTLTVHIDAPDPVPTGSSTLTARVEEDAAGDLNAGNDAMSISINTSDWGLSTNTGTNGGNSDANPLTVIAGASAATVIQPTLSGSGDFAASVNLVNGIVSSRITATPSLTSLNSTRQQITYTINASNTAAQGFYAAQLIAQFVDGGRPTAQRQATVHVQVTNAGNSGDTVSIASSRNNACTSGCQPVQINGLLLEGVGLTTTRSSGTTGSVDIHFTDPASIVSNVTARGSPLSPILHAVPYGTPANVLFAAAQDASGSLTPGPAQVTVSATSIQTSAMQGGPTPQPVGPNSTTLQFTVGDLQLATQPCFNLAPGAEGVVQLSFTTLGGFNVPSISWTVSSLPPGVALNSVTSVSTLSGGSYTPVSVDLTNTNPAEISTSQTLTLIGSISNSNGSANVAFAPSIQLHSGSCTPGLARNAMLEGGVRSGTRGIWSRGGVIAASARNSSIRTQAVAAADVRLIAGEVSYTPSLPRQGDTVQVRFRLTNFSNVDAHDVPVSLLVNGAVVATDTFDVNAGKTTLAGLTWTNAQPPANARTAVSSAMMVVDAARNARAAVASGKVAPLAHFSLAGGPGASEALVVGGHLSRNRAVLQLAESACAGFRFSSGASASCGTGDLDIAFEDAASGRFSLTSDGGIADLGAAYAGNLPATLQYTNRLQALPGHSYAVKLRSGQIGVLTISGINNPLQKAAAADKVFRGGAPRRLARKLGKVDGPVETGDVSGGGTESAVATLQLLYGEQ